MRAAHLVYTSRLMNRTRKSHCSYACHLALVLWKWAINICCAEDQWTEKCCENMNSGGETSFYSPILHIYNLIHPWQMLYQSTTSHEHGLRSTDWYSRILCHWHKMLIISCCSSVPCLHLWFLINGKMVVNPAGNTGGWFAWGFRTILIISFCSSKTSS